ncbi:MAG TPA: hypothetical protein VH518_05645, partial [Tepidisphaeraceae bacterium]
VTTYNLDGASSYISVEGALGTLTLPAGATIRGGNGGGIWFDFITGGSGNGFVSNGTIQADLVGKTFTIFPSGSNPFVNNGNLVAMNGATLTVSSPNWSTGSLGALSTSGTGAINLGGSFSAANLTNNVTRAGGTINITGNVSNAGNTLALTATTGDFFLNGGSINGGSITSSGGNMKFTSAGGNRFNNVTFTGNLLLDQNNSRLALINGGSISGSATLSGSSAVLGFFDSFSAPAITYNLDGASTYISTEGSGTLIFPVGTIIRGGNGGGIWNTFFGGTGATNTVINNGVIQSDLPGKLFTIFPSGNTFTNNGTISAINGSTMTISAATWSNSGNINATNSTLNFTGVWSNTGSININNSTLSLGGTFSTSSLSNINRTGGTVSVTGAWNNAGSGFAFSTTTGDWLLNGGVINGGSLTETTGLLHYSVSSSNRFNGVAVNGPIVLDISSGRVGFSGSNTISGSASLSASSTVVGFFDTITIPATTYNLDGASSYLSTEGVGTMTFPAGATIRGGNNGGIWNTFLSGTSASNTVINNGAIVADLGGKGFTIFPSGSNTFINNGSISAINGATMTISAATWSNSSTGNISATSSFVNFSNAWSNAGTTTINNSTLTLGGSFSTSSIGTLIRTGGAVLVTGSWNNASSGFTFTNSTGSWLLSNGTVSGGSLNFTSVNKLGVAPSTTGTISGVTINGDMDVSLGSAKLYVQTPSTFNGAVNLSGSSTVLGFLGTQTISATTYNLDGSSSYLSTEGSGGNTLTIPSGALVRGGNDGGIWYGFINNAGAITNTVINNGTIRADIGGHNFTVFPSGSNSFNNNGSLQATSGGKLIVNLLNGPLNHVSADGLGSTIRLSGTYTINVPISVTNRATLDLKGNWTKSADIDVSGRVIFDYTGPTIFNTIRSQIITGRNGGLWNGPGINSSAAINTPLTALGYGEASTVVGANGGSFSGEPVDSTAIVVRWTRVGDADLDGDADGVDIGTWATNFTGELGGTGTRIWTQGDWDYDGDADGVDAGLWAQAFTGELGGNGLGSVVVNDPSISPGAAAILRGLGVTVVPEPGTIGFILGIAVTGLCRARRRR